MAAAHVSPQSGTEWVRDDTNPDVIETLETREHSYGNYREGSRVAENIKKVLRDSLNWSILSDFQKNALDMTAQKLSRILNGDPNHFDSWHDITGYIELVAIELKNEQKT